MKSAALGVSLGLLTLLAASCGGSTREDSSSAAGSGGRGGDAGAAGANGRGGSGGSAGTAGGAGGSSGTSVGGSGAGGGAAAGGSAGAAGGAGTGGSSGGGTGGAGGGLPARCQLPSDPGNCDALIGAYFHDSKTGVCEPFIWGGCGGNENRFPTRAACQAACRGGAPDMDACSTTSDCTLTPAYCCGGCEPVSGGQLVGVNRRHLRDFALAKDCGNVICDSCPEVDELGTSRQYYVSICEAGACGVVDIRETPVTECARDQDCQLRDTAECCDECDGRGLVSVQTAVNRELMCRAVEACPPCVGIIPPEYSARCVEGRCAVTRTSL